MTSSPLSFILALIVSLSLAKSNAADIQDDFLKESGQWRFSQGGGKGKHTIQNSRLEFTTQRTSTNNDSATYYLRAIIGRYDESWQVQADVYLGSFPLGAKDPYAGLALRVGNVSKTDRSFIRVQLRKGANDRRAFNADAYAGRKHLGSEWSDTSAVTATIKIQFDGKTKVLTASYDADGPGAAATFLAFYKLDIGKGSNAWKMRSSDVFEFSMVSQSTRTVVSSGDMYFDNAIVKNLGR
jgi:hypothetical protein